MTQTKYDKVVSVYFSGHRNILFLYRKQLKLQLRAAVTRIYAGSYRYFYYGYAVGFGMLAAEAAFVLQPELSGLQVIAVVPYHGQSERWNDAVKTRYGTILYNSDDTIILSECCYHGCLLRRNDCMVSHNSSPIAWYDGNPRGGAFYTYHKATASGLKILNLYGSSIV